jgi:predicted nucleic-acid-binding Zn-ribbon protein
MARLSKDCPKCGGPRPVAVSVVQPPLDNPGDTITYVVECRGCGYTYPSDADVVRDGKAYLDAQRAAREKT